MIKCLQCDKDAVVLEEYKRIPIRVCEDGHRTAEFEDKKKEQIVAYENERRAS